LHSARSVRKTKNSTIQKEFFGCGVSKKIPAGQGRKQKGVIDET